MPKDVIRFSAVIQRTGRSIAKEDAFIAQCVPAILEATDLHRQWYYFSRHYDPEKGVPDTVWLVCKAQPESGSALAAAGRSPLEKALADNLIEGSCIEAIAEEEALGKDSKVVVGVDNVLHYESFWRFVDAASRAALQIIQHPIPIRTRDAVCVVCPGGPPARVDIGAHWQHFFWNALGINDIRVPLIADPD